MKLLLPFLAILLQFATGPLEGKILILNENRSLAEDSKSWPEEVSTRESSSDYQRGLSARVGGALAKAKDWVASEEMATVGPLAIGLFLLIVPLPFSRFKANSQDGRKRAADSNLRRIGQSWDPRF
jgi:hypothetical protein